VPSSPTNKPRQVFGQAASMAMVLPREYAGNVSRDINHALLELLQVEGEVSRLKELKLWNDRDAENLETLRDSLELAQKAIGELKESLKG
jgi:hypothetical protein